MIEHDLLLSIGKRLAEIRRSHKVTQESLANTLGVSPKHISHTECGTSSLSLKNLIEFCNLFDCSLDYIVFGQSRNNALDRLPKDTVKLLCTGSEEEIGRLNRYLSVYTELLNKQD